MIVNAAFNQSYADFIRICANSTPESFRLCMTTAYTMLKNESLPYSTKWPWWFQNMLRDGSKLTSGIHGPWHKLQYEEPKLRQCVIEKVGTKQWQKLYSKVQNCPLANATHIHLFTKCYTKHPQIPNSERFVFLRDPLDRFLSGFLNKCGEKSRDSQHCEPLSIMIDDKTQLVNDYRNDMQKLFEIYVDVIGLKWNLHFYPQSLYCDGLYNHFEDYNFVGSMEDGFEGHLHRFVDQYPQLKEKVQENFPRMLSTMNGDSSESNTNTSRTIGVETKAASKVESIYTPHSLRRVLEYTSIDYTMLNIPIPEWAERMLREDS
jgi:hypothetical protein